MKVQAFIKGRAVVSEDEILTDYHLNRDQIKVAYVGLRPRVIRKQCHRDGAGPPELLQRITRTGTWNPKGVKLPT